MKNKKAAAQRLAASKPGGYSRSSAEFLALDNVKVAEYALGLTAEQCLEFAPHARGDTGGVVHQPGDFVEKPVRRLDHDCLRTLLAAAARHSSLRPSQTMAMVRRGRKGSGGEGTALRARL
jgi:hypothetical protein